MDSVIIARLFPDAPVYTLFHFPGTVSAALEKHPIHTSFLQSYPGTRTHYRRYLPLFPAAIENFDLGGYDLLISTSHCVAKGARPAPGTLHICYCHTPMRYAWDQEHTYFPQRTGAGGPTTESRPHSATQLGRHLRRSRRCLSRQFEFRR